MTDFGPAQTIKITDLRAGDFVVSIPTQMRVRGITPRSAIESICWAHEHPGYGTWTQSNGYRRRRSVVPSRVMTFVSGDTAGWNYPHDFDVLVRRPVVDLADDALSADEIAPCLLCSDPACKPGQTFCDDCEAATAPAI